tara:strand:- start:260 stop:478 length:219 start_codon:yes stop_codon:yes gene_type:complete
MLFTRNKRDTKNLTLLNKLVATGEPLEYINGEWWFDGKQYATIEHVAKYMMIPLSTTNFVLHSYTDIKRVNA